MIDFLVLVARLAGQLEAELIHDANIHLGEHDRGVHLAAAEFFSCSRACAAFGSLAAFMESAIRISSVWRRGFFEPRS